MMYIVLNYKVIINRNNIFIKSFTYNNILIYLEKYLAVNNKYTILSHSNVPILNNIFSIL